MKRVFLPVVILAAALDCRRASAPALQPVKDVVLITIDTCRADAVGFGGNTRGTTPHLDAVAAEGLVFTQAHGQNVLTLPSHTNILTGLYPTEHGVHDNAGFRLEDRFATAATILREKGYATGAFVAAFPLDSRYGLARGFDVYDMLYRQSEDSTEFRVQQSPGPVVVAAALAWYRKHSDKPRFLWVHLYDPHAPYDPPPEFRAKFSDDLYLGDVAFADDSLAPLLDAVAAGSAPATLLIVTGDHGESRGEHGELTHGLFAYEATLHVPLLLWSRGLARKGRDTDLARHIDILPTILEAVGDRTPRGLPGASLLGDRRGAASRSSYFESLAANYNRGWAPLRGILQGSRKYIDLPVPELYDLSSDPTETKNRIGEEGQPLRKLRSEFLRFPAEIRRPGGVDPEQAARLKSLGYLSGSAAPKAVYGPLDDPKNLIAVDRQIHESVELFERGDKAGALRLVRELVKENPRMQLAHQHLAFLLEEKGDMEGALEALDRAVKNGVASEALDRRRGLLLSEAGRPAEAIAVLEPYRKSRDGETLNALGIALADAGRIDDGLAVFRGVLAADPVNVQAHQNIGIALLKANRADALEPARKSLEKSVQLSVRNPKAWNALGVAWMRDGSPERALEAWASCVRYGPQEYDALYNIGIVASRIGDRPRARQALEAFVSQAPPARYARELAQVREMLKGLS